MRGSVRREARIERPADEVWALLGDAGRIHEWFPGIASSTVGEQDREGEVRIRIRTITTGNGTAMPERILTEDPLLRRFQYRLELPLLREHTSTLDVVDLGDGTSLAVYSVDADPAAMALIIGGAAGNALRHAKSLLEAQP